MSDYYVHRLQVSMSLAVAETIANGAIAAGRDAGLLPLTVAVLDAGGVLVVQSVQVPQDSPLKVTLVDGSGREIQSATRAGDSNQLTVGGTVPAGVYSLRFSGYGNGTQLEVRTPVQR